MIVVTNIEADHLDYFGSVEAYVKVFDDFVDKLRPGGLLIACLDDPGSADLAKRIVASGRSDIRVLGTDRQTRRKWRRAPPSRPVHGVEVGVRLLGFHAHDVGGVLQFHLAGESAARTVRMAVPGRHMALNALAALLAARDAGAETEEIVEGLAGFGGVHRRFQFTAASVVSGCSTTTPTIRPKFVRFSARRRIWFDRRTIRRRPIRQPDA